MNRRGAVTLVLICLVVPSAGLAQPARAAAEVEGRASPGDVIYVMDAEGRETKGTLLALSDTALTLSLLGDRYEVPLDRIAWIERDGDSVWSGLAIGAATPPRSTGGPRGWGSRRSCRKNGRGSRSRFGGEEVGDGSFPGEAMKLPPPVACSLQFKIPTSAALEADAASAAACAAATVRGSPCGTRTRPRSPRSSSCRPAGCARTRPGSSGG